MGTQRQEQTTPSRFSHHDVSFLGFDRWFPSRLLPFGHLGRGLFFHGRSSHLYFRRRQSRQLRRRRVLYDPLFGIHGSVSFGEAFLPRQPLPRRQGLPLLQPSRCFPTQGSPRYRARRRPTPLRQEPSRLPQRQKPRLQLALERPPMAQTPRSSLQERRNLPYRRYGRRLPSPLLPNFLRLP